MSTLELKREKIYITINKEIIIVVTRPPSCLSFLYLYIFFKIVFFYLFTLSAGIVMMVVVKGTTAIAWPSMPICREKWARRVPLVNLVVGGIVAVVAREQEKARRGDPCCVCLFC
jgi:hypothetical protein